MKTIKCRYMIPKPYEKLLEYLVSVTVDGEFTTTIPDPWPGIMAEKGIVLDLNRNGRHGFFRSDTLKGLQAAIAATFAVLCSEELIEEKDVILYQIGISCAYTKSTDGTDTFFPFIVPGDTTEWKTGNVPRGSSCRDGTPYGVSVFALPQRKRTYRFVATGKQRTEYTSLRKHDFCVPETDTQWLSSLVGMAKISDLEMQEIELTDKTAAFFRRIFESIFNTNELIKSLLAPDELRKLAEKGTNLLGR